MDQSICWSNLGTLSWTFYFADATIDIPLMGRSISVTSAIARTSQVLCIFSWKQVFLSIFRKNKCVLIKYSPLIKWESDTESTKNLKPHIFKQTSSMNVVGDKGIDKQVLEIVPSNSTIREIKEVDMELSSENDEDL